MLTLRGALLVALGLASLQALLLYFVAAGLLLHVLNFFDAFHHTFEQFFAEADAPVPAGERDRAYEQANTYSNVISTRWPWLNLLTLNFGYHNAHHERAAVPWYRLPALHAELHGDLPAAALLPLRELLVTWVRHRVRRVACDDYGTLGTGRGRAGCRSSPSSDPHPRYPRCVDPACTAPPFCCARSSSARRTRRPPPGR
jgi:fatty acid desaturase